MTLIFFKNKKECFLDHINFITCLESSFYAKELHMKHILTVMFFLILTTSAFAKGGSGTYYIKGTAHGKGKAILKNVELRVKIGGTTKTIKTDANGMYIFEVRWTSACASSRTFGKFRRDNKKLNAEFIYMSFVDKEIKLRNEWKKYGDLLGSGESATRMKNLFFA